MADITLTIPDALISRAIDGISVTYDYDVQKKEVETKAQFAKRMLIEKFVIPAVKTAEVVTSYKINKATIEADIDSVLIIT